MVDERAKLLETMANFDHWFAVLASVSRDVEEASEKLSQKLTDASATETDFGKCILEIGFRLRSVNEKISEAENAYRMLAASAPRSVEAGKRYLQGK